MERGRPRSFATPQDLWDEFVEYCDKTKEQPILVKDWIGPKAVQVYREKEAPLTMEGFKLHLWDKGIADGGRDYFSNKGGAYEDFSAICSRIKEAIRADQIKGGKIDFDILIASPDAMRIVGTLGQILGPRGLMPNPKVGTVSPDVAGAVKNAKAGQVQFRVDKAGIVHATIGRRSFEPGALKNNLVALLDALTKAKPAASKGIYLRKVAVSSTMGAGVRVDQNSLAA